MQSQTANAQASPLLDEATFQQILQAAYIIQEQNDLRCELRPKLDPAATLSLIAETQELLHSQLYDTNAAAYLIAERLRKITNATGAAIAVIANDQLRYCAATGSCASLAGSNGPIGSSVSELLREQDAWRRAPNGVHENSPSFFPIYREGQIVGLLQLSFPESEPIQEHEIRSCQLMAGLMGETISRAAELEWKQSLAAERATMLEALEQLRPQLERLAAEPAKAVTPEPVAAAPTSVVSSVLEAAHTAPIAAPLEPADLAIKTSPTGPELVDITSPSSTCGNCGFRLSDDAIFCGRCGTARLMEIPAPAELTSDSGNEEATRELEVIPEATPALVAEMPIAVAVEPTLAQFASDTPATEGSAALAIDQPPAEPGIAEEQKSSLEVVGEPKPAQPSPWSSAARARKWLHSLQQTETAWLAKHSGDVSVVIAALVLLLVLVGWNTHPAPKKVARTNTPSQPSLTLFERMLVGLGLAEAPSAPAQVGNPNAQVWEDLHTGLYYCADSDLYGKTPGGKVTSQRDAQLDQFEPAARKICE